MSQAQARFALHAWAAPVLVAAVGGALAVHFTALPPGTADLGAHLATCGGVAAMLAVPGASSSCRTAAIFSLMPSCAAPSFDRSATCGCINCTACHAGQHCTTTQAG